MHRPTRAAAVLAAPLAVVAIVAGCGGSGSSSNTGRRGRETIVEHTLRVDPVLGPIDADDSAHLDMGHAAVGAERHVMVTLARHYYKAAAAENGRAACALLYSVAVNEAVEELPHAQGVPGGTCPQVMTAIFVKLHPWLLAKLRSFKVVRVRSEGINGYVIMRFSTTAPDKPARELALRHEHGVWSIHSPLDVPLP